MKKRLLIATIAVFGITSVNAQGISFGVKGGINLANLRGDIEETDMKTGLHIGILAEFMLTEKFALQPELLYSMQGSKSEVSQEIMGMNYSYETKLKLDYISFPILAKYYITDGLSVHAGPQLGLLVSANFEYEGTVNGETESGEADAKDFFKSLDYGVTVGASYQLEMGLFFNARYYLGLADISEDIELYGLNSSEVEMTIQNIETKNAMIQVSVGYMF